MQAFFALLAVFSLVCMTPRTAAAGNFSEMFRDFVFGTDAQAFAVSKRAVLSDRSASDCLGCHNGAAAKRISVKDADAPFQTRGFQTVNHPVGMSYDRYAMKDPRGYRPRLLLDKNIRLVDGKVSCVSCHRLKSDVSAGMWRTAMTLNQSAECTASGELTVGHSSTDLCVACHTDKY